ncbi:iron ABC transporter permease [Salsipaludibacter albus]|uniref:iron ABC transporter permease n=1 Tax=Salsipaludibacter albus TaxID=2849650 RepID=UPI001EE3C66C|nr:iron ABC transporter permease [Salsipaludibacter albus]MBY5161596.1 iron ABC transporter permease [Salsipaludibacter albus]
MSDLATRPAPPTQRSGGAGRVVSVAAFLLVATAVGVLAVVDLGLGTADVGLVDIARLAIAPDDTTAAVLVASRLPRVLAALVVGGALGASGLVLQAIARNPLASPDTLAVNAGGYLAVVAVAALGIPVPFVLSGALAFVGGLLAAGLVLVLARGGADGPARLVLAGSALTLALHAVTMALLILFEQETVGLYAWGAGNIALTGTATLQVAAWPVVVGLVGAAALGRRLDLLGLGDDAAQSLGVPVRRTRVAGVLVAVLLAAAAVTVAGPIGFVGLSGPVVARLLARRVPGLGRHTALVPFAALCGVAVVLLADVALRLLLPAQASLNVPTGVATTLLGAMVMVWLVRRMRDTVPTSGSSSPGVRPRTRRRATVVTAVLVILVVAALVAGVLLGDRLVLLGDVANWLGDRAGRQVDFVLGQRVPRVLAALLAGAALGVAGDAVQTVCRNPLAEPGLLGVTAGAGFGAVCAVLFVPGAPVWLVSAAATAAALATFGAVYRLSSRGGLATDRMVLVGVATWAGAGALTTIVIQAVAPWDATIALTWLAGSTYGRSLVDLVPVALALTVVVPMAWLHHRELDLLALDETSPRVLGVEVGRIRLVLLAAAAVLTASSVSAVGVVGFVGLVAPHAARALVGASHARSIVVSGLLGALLVATADTVGRWALAPVQLPAGLVTAVLGAPYFVWLLWRQRGARP